ncbi:lipase family protein [Nocardia sp. NPDC004068]|uniref:lipase family protein n=1 Tax=Nocardia sp. NPDC004068 TaxID=3364303 RepID=UPI0036AB59F5
MRTMCRAVVVALLAVCVPGVATAAPDDAASGRPGSLIAVLPQDDGWHHLSGGSIVEYWMTGSDGAARPASGALFLPSGPPPPGGWPIMAYDHGTSGLGQGCGHQSDPVTPGSQPEGTALPRAGGFSESVLLQHLLDQGMAVVAPDYLGLGRFATGPHPYLEVDTEASATIDLVRAARAAHPELSRTWAVIGGSQGGQAALGTAQRQRILAPDLDFRGVIAVDPESDAEDLLPLAGPGIPALAAAGGGETALVAMMLVGLRAAHPELDIDGYLTPLGRDILETIATQCLPQIGARLRGMAIGDLLSKPLSDERFRRTVADYLAVPTDGYDAPILLLFNTADLVVPSPLHATLAAQFAAHGVAYDTVVGTGSHTQLDPRMWTAIDRFIAPLRP